MKIDIFNPPSKYEVVFVASVDGVNIGTAGLYRWINNSWEFRINILPPYQGKGYGTDLTKIVIGYGFETLKLDKIWLGVDRENKPAVRIYEKAGFKEDNILRMSIESSSNRVR